MILMGKATKPRKTKTTPRVETKQLRLQPPTAKKKATPQKAGMARDELHNKSF
jgi:hypothetical protein